MYPQHDDQRGCPWLNQSKPGQFSSRVGSLPAKCPLSRDQGAHHFARPLRESLRLSRRRYPYLPYRTTTRHFLYGLLDDSWIGWIPESNGYPAVPSSLRPSAVHSVKYFTVRQITTPSEPSGNSISLGAALFASFHNATIRDGFVTPSGRLRVDIPRLVRVRTEQPGSSAKVVA